MVIPSAFFSGVAVLEGLARQGRRSAEEVPGIVFSWDSGPAPAPGLILKHSIQRAERMSGPRVLHRMIRPLLLNPAPR